jgi:proline dehydrogenase
MISFDNTEIAFAHRSNSELRKARFLFRLIGNPGMVSFGKWATNVALKTGMPIGWALRGNIFSHFCGGETIEQCSQTIKALGQKSVGTILDHSVEGKESEAEFDLATEEILATVVRSAGDDDIPFSVFKVTGLARFALLEKVQSGETLTSEESAEFNRVKRRIASICQKAAEAGTPVLIDAEESWIQETIDCLAEEMMAMHNRERALVYHTLQMYRHDRLAYLHKIHESARQSGHKIGVKIVRGAYMEKERERAAAMGYPSPIQPDKASTDRDYDSAIEYCLNHLEEIALCAGTHNEQSSAKLARMMDERNIPHKHPHVFFSQLLGMSDHISFNLAHAGFNVAKYVPYGPIREVIPYLIRRAEENTSVKGQTSRELALLQKESKRRSKHKSNQ